MNVFAAKLNLASGTAGVGSGAQRKGAGHSCQSSQKRYLGVPSDEGLRDERRAGGVVDQAKMPLLPR